MNVKHSDLVLLGEALDDRLDIRLTRFKESWADAISSDNLRVFRLRILMELNKLRTTVLSTKPTDDLRAAQGEARAYERVLSLLSPSSATSLPNDIREFARELREGAAR